MKNKITDYQLVVEFDENELEEKVQELIDIKDECWEPFGSLVVTTHPHTQKLIMFQPMVKMSSKLK